MRRRGCDVFSSIHPEKFEHRLFSPTTRYNDTPSRPGVHGGARVSPAKPHPPASVISITASAAAGAVVGAGARTGALALTLPFLCLAFPTT